MNINLMPKPVNFKFGEYINKGIDLLKKDFGNVFVGFLMCFIMSIIPFCGLLAAGNLYKYLQKLNRNQPTSPGEIFDFKDFMPYFILQLIIIAGVIALYIPIMILGVLGGLMSNENGEPSAGVMIFMFPYMFLMIIALYYFLLRGFYMIPLISFKGITDIKTVWNISTAMTKGNLWSILLFAIVVGILSQIGILACGIGIFITIPFMYAANYFAYEDAIQQIEHDEITEIGSKNEF